MKKQILFVLMAAALLVAGCEEEEKMDPEGFEAKTKDIVGRYEICRVFWSGLSADLDGDGIGRHEMLDEYENILGWSHKMSWAEIDADVKNETARLEARIPYPILTKEEDRYVATKIDYLPLSIEISDLDRLYHNSLRFHNPEDNSDIYLSTVDEILISEMEDGTLTLRVHCALVPDDIYYLYLTFRKE